MKNRIAVAGVELMEGFDPATGTLTITVIKPGFNKSKGRFYPAEMLTRDRNVFDGAKMFADHQTEAQAKAQPGGSVNNWVATMGQTWAESDGTIKAKATVIDPSFKAKLTELAKNNMLKDMGVSIRAIGSATPRVVDGVKTNYVESLLKARSVDFVTYAGAGGQVEAMESDDDGNDVDLVTEEQLRARRPDLIQLVESQAQEKHMDEKEQIKKLTDDLAAANAGKIAAEKKVQEAETASKKAVAQAELTKMLSESKLPQVAKDRLKKQFAEAVEVKGMKEAIDEEDKYIKSVSENKTKKHNGANDNVSEEDNTDGKKTDLVSSFKLLGLTEAEAKVAAAGRLNA